MEGEPQAMGVSNVGIINTFKCTGSVADLPHSGRPKISVNIFKTELYTNGYFLSGFCERQSLYYSSLRLDHIEDQG